MKTWVIVAITLGLAINDIFQRDFLEKPVRTIVGLIVTFVILYFLNYVYMKFFKKDNTTLGRESID